MADQETALAKLQSLLKNAQLDILVDRRQTILDSAITYQRNGQSEFSLVFYAIFFEHTINNLIFVALGKKKIDKKTINAAIRTANLEAKFGWLIEILGLPAFSDRHRRVILSIASERNAFVHYKWDPSPDETATSDQRSRRIGELSSSARKAVAYIRGYESRYLFRNKKHKIRKVTGRRPSNSLKPTPPRGAA